MSPVLYVKPSTMSQITIWLPYYEYKSRKNKKRVYCEASLSPKAEKDSNRILGVTSFPLSSLAEEGLLAQGIIVEPSLAAPVVMKNIIDTCKNFSYRGRVRWHIRVGDEEGLKALLRELLERLFLPPHRKRMELEGIGLEGGLARSFCSDLIKLLDGMEATGVTIYRPFGVMVFDNDIRLIDLANIGDRHDQLLNRIIQEEASIKRRILKLLRSQVGTR